MRGNNPSLPAGGPRGTISRYSFPWAGSLFQGVMDGGGSVDGGRCDSMDEFEFEAGDIRPQSVPHWMADLKGVDRARRRL